MKISDLAQGKRENETVLEVRISNTKNNRKIISIASLF